MIIELKHALDRTESIGRIKKILTDLKKQYGSLISNGQEIWKDDTVNIRCKINKCDFNGIVQCYEHKIKLDLEIPLVASIFRSRIKNEIDKYAKDYLS